MLILATILLAIASAILYRMGGAAGYSKLWRRLGCMFATALWIFLFLPRAPWWLYIIGMGAQYGLASSYYDEIFGYDNHWFHGFMIGVATLVYLSIVPWWIIMIRAVVCGLTIGAWSKFNDHDVTEECGRGALIILTLPMLLL